MCGIAGILEPEVRLEELRAMTNSIAHRGPDGEGTAIRDGVGFGHRRLAIIDLAGGEQPMRSRGGDLWITFNGEIYNYRELRAGLEGKYQFKTQSDIEVILKLYEEYGEKCLGMLRGMFAFAIYDFRARRLFLARDHLGQKPLYYARDGERFGFCSEIKGLLAWRPSLRQMDPAALYEYLSLRIITAPRSMFRGVHKLPAGHFLVLEDGQLRIERYWDLHFEPKPARDFRATLDELDEKVAEAVRYNMVADVPVGAFLSGGLDSSLVVAHMSKAASGFPTFSGDVPYGEYSELPWCRMVSDRYATDPREMEIRPSLVRTLPDIVWHMDEPSDPLSTCLYYISQLARRDVKVALGGDGGDELFGGYDRYYGNVYASWYALLPEWFRRQLVSRALKLVPEGYWYRSVSHQLRWLNQMSFYSAGERYGNSLSYFYFSPQWRDAVFAPKLVQEAAGFDPVRNLAEFFDAPNASELIDRMLYTDSMTRMPDHPVMILDRMSMAHGLEARSPFLDHELAEFCARMPPRFKVRRTRRRYIQVELARRYLPEKLLNREKQGFASPLVYLLDAEFKHLYGTLLRDSQLVAAGYLQADGVNALLEAHLGRRADHGQRLWQLCNAEIWYRMYIGGEERDAMRERIQAAA